MEKIENNIKKKYLRHNNVIFRVTDKELEWLHTLAYYYDMNVSSYLRYLIYIEMNRFDEEVRKEV